MRPATPSEDRLPEPAADPSSPRGTPRAAEARPVTPVTEAPTGYVSVGHELLFAPDAPRCDACGSELPSPDDDLAASAAGDRDEIEGGHGLYIWARHGEVVYEEPPLCASCAAAITITALQRWEIEEEEG